jgi:hypothetical protein
VTEFGPLGAWDCPKDKNGIPFDPYDHVKSNDYASIWRQIKEASAKCLGGFSFVLGEPRNQDSLSWYNLNYGELKRDAFWTLYAAFRGRKAPERAPKITGMTLSKAEHLAPGQRIDVKVTASDADHDKLTYEYFITSIASDPLIVEPPSFYPAETEVYGPGQASVRVPNDPGRYRVYALVTDGRKNAAITSRSVHVAGH